MSENPYQAPNATIAPKNTLPGPLWKAVGIGVAIDIGGTILMSFIATLFYSMSLAAEGSSASDVQSAMTALDPLSPFALLTSILGLAMSVIGGYWCAVIANRTTYLAPTLMAVGSLVVAFALGGLSQSWALTLFMAALSVAAVYLGASLAIKKLAGDARGR